MFGRLSEWFSDHPILGVFAALAVADAALVATEILSVVVPQWGIYLNGSPVIQPANVVTQALQAVLPLASPLAAIFGISLPIAASFVDMDYKQDWPTSDYPVEQGSFQSYDKVQLPFNIPVRLAFSGPAVQRQQFLSVINTMANSLNLYDVYTPEGAYTSCSVDHVEFHRDATRVSMIVVDVWFEQIRETSTAIFPNTQSPASAGTQAQGSVNAVPYTNAPFSASDFT